MKGSWWKVLSGAAAMGCASLVLSAGMLKAWGRAPRFATEHEMGGHLEMTALQPAAPGDKARADAIVLAAKKYAEGYTDFHKALAEGYTIFHPEADQRVYHFTLGSAAYANEFGFDANRPTSLLYEKTGKAGYKLVGVMYTAPYRAAESELNARVPLSVAQWHLHTNLCLPPSGEVVDWKAKDAKFGLRGSITTAAACKAEGGHFMPHLFGWMVHVYPFEADPAKIWAAGMDDDEMDHEAMPGMKMEPGTKMAPGMKMGGGMKM